jgi:hypothetical protein
MVEYIYYTGIGSKKSGKHTVKEFLSIMNKKFNIKCSDYLSDLDTPCREYNELRKKAPIAYFDSKQSKLTFKFSSNNKSDNKKLKNLSKKCTKYKKTMKTRKCKLKDYIKFSGANIKK